MKFFVRMTMMILLLTGMWFANAAAPARAAVGGPDGFGYRYVDSLTPGGPVYNFEDISGSGTLVPLGDATLSPAIPLGFSFSFYGTGYTQVYVCANGYLTFVANPSDPGRCPYPVSALTPNASLPQNLIAGWWADLNPSANLTDSQTGAPNGTVKYQVLGAAPNRRVIVQFTNILHYNYAIPTTGVDPVTMEYKLFEGTSYIEVHYQAAPASNTGWGPPVNHSAGIENSTGSTGLSYYFNTGSLATPLAVRYYFNDSTAPETTLLTMPADPTNQTTATFTFTASDAGSGVSSFQCRLDGGSYAACTSPWISGVLGNGSHTFEVYAVDYRNNADPTPASYTWTVDAAAPDIPVLVSPTNGINLDLGDPANVTFQWEISAGAAGYNLKINDGVSDTVIDVGNVTSSIQGPLNKGVKYSWSVQAYADSPDGHVSAYAPAWRFTIGTPTYLPIIRR